LHTHSVYFCKFVASPSSTVPNSVSLFCSERQVMKLAFVEKMEQVIENESSVKHTQMAEDVEETITNPAKVS
jgi:hypothetical protein